MKRSLFSLLAAAVLLCGGVLPCRAGANRTWTGGGDSNWYSASNWSPAGIPTAADNMTIDVNATVRVDPSSPAIQFASLDVGDALGTNAPTLWLATAAASAGALTVHPGATLLLATTQQVLVGSVDVQPGGVVTSTANAASLVYDVNIRATGAFTLENGAAIAVSSLGYAGGISGSAGSGPGGGGAGTAVSTPGGAGGGHGGAGGNGGDGTTPAGGSSNDSSTNPGNAGSGGGGAGLGGGAGGAGGGVVLLVAGGAMTLNGYVIASGSAAANGSGSGAGGGGAGGAISISAASLFGGGTLTANGGSGGFDSGGAKYSGGGGGGGRIAVAVSGYNGSTLTYSVANGANGGGSAKAGALGGVYPQPGDISNLAVQSIVSTGLGASSETVTLAWTAPAPGAAGAFNNYDLRWATYPLTSMAVYNGVGAPYQNIFSTSLVAGVRVSTALADIDPTTTWYFALTVSDRQLLRNDLSNGATALAYVYSFGNASGLSQGLAVGDAENSGLPDVVEARSGGGVHVWHNAGAFAFTDGGTVAGTLAQANGVSLADYNNDGFLDIAVADTAGAAQQVLQSNAGTSFAAAVSGWSGQNVRAVAWGDYNNAGRPSFAAANYAGSSFIGVNNGDGTFSTTTLLGTVSSATAVAWGDYDQSGWLSLAVARDSNMGVVIAHNNGDGTFSTMTLTGTGNATSVAWGDYDGDGWLDLAVGRSDSDVMLFRNHGDGTFGQVGAFTGFGNNARSVAWGDYNADGRPDLLVTPSAGQAAIYVNQGSGSFARVLLGGTTGDAESGAWADLDGNGTLDVAIASAGPAQLLVLRNDAALSTSAPTAPSAGFGYSWQESSTLSSSGTLTLRWSAGSDAFTPAGDLLYWVRVGTTTGASGVSRVPSPNSERGRSRLANDRIAAGQPGFKLVNVAKGAPVYWAVTSENAGYLRSAASGEQTSDLTAPAAVALAGGQDTTVVTSSTAWVVLNFSAPGEQGASGNLLSGAVYDLRWSSAGPISAAAAYSSAPYQALVSAQGTAGAAVTLRVAVTPGVTWHFALTTKNSHGVRSGTSNDVSVYTPLVREVVDDVATLSQLEGGTTAFLRLKLWTEGAGATVNLLQVNIRKFGTLPDHSISQVGLYFDHDGVFDANAAADLRTAPAVFASSQATLTLSPSFTLSNTTAVFYVAAVLRPDYLPVPGSTISVRLDGQALQVSSGGVEQIDFPGMRFDGVSGRVLAPFNSALDVGPGGQVTVEAWVRSTDTARSNASIVTRTSGGNNGYALWLNGAGCGGGVPTFFVGLSHICAVEGGAPLSVADGRWHHVAAVYNVGTAGQPGQFFVDGVALATASMTGGTLSDAVSDLGVGGPNSSVGAYFLGQLDEVRVSGYARYPAELPPLRRNGNSGAVVLYHFDGLGPDSVAADATANGINGSVLSGAAGYARSTETVVTHIPDTLYAQLTPLLPSGLYRNELNIPVAKLQLWTGGDFFTLNQLSLAATGSALASSVNNVIVYSDTDGDGVFQSTVDTPLTLGQSFSGGKATFSFVSAGTAQTIWVATQTYFIAWNVSGSASDGANIGIMIATTDFVPAYGDSVSTQNFPLASGTAPIVAAQAFASAETATGTWVNVSSMVFDAAFGTGNISYLDFAWDESSGTSVNPAAGVPPGWSAGKTTVTATTDNSDWYFHARAYDSFNSPGTQVDLGPFWVDQTPPAGSGFESFNSTGGALAESQIGDLASGVTAQLTVSDAASGLDHDGPAPLAPSSTTVSLWHLDETAGSWADAGPAGNALSDAGGAGRGPGRFKGGLLLGGGANAFLQQASPAGLPTGDAPRSVEAWLEPASTSGLSGIFSYGAAGAGNQLNFAQSGLGLYADVGGAGFASGAALSTGVWQHVALTFDGAALRLYAGGVLVSSSAVGALTTAAGTLKVGALVGGSPFHGGIDEVRLSAGAYAASDVASHAQRGDPFYVSYSSGAGGRWTYLTSTSPALGPFVALTGTQGTTAPQTLSVSGLSLVVSTSTATGALATNQVRFHFSDAAGNVATAGPFAILVDTNAGAAVSTPSLPGAGRYAGLTPSFYWTAPSTALVQGLGGQFFLQVSSADPAFAPGNLVVSIATPAVVADVFSSSVTGVYLSTFTLSEGATYYWRVRSRSSLGVFGPWGPAAGFVTDVTSPAAAGFAVYNSTGGVFNQTGPIDLLSGTTVQLGASDAVAGLSQALSPTVPAGAAAYWPFSEREGAAPVDLAQGLVGTLTCSGVGCQPARYGLTPFGAGLHLSGAQYMTAPNTAFQFPAASTFTVSAWLRPTAVNVNQVVAALGAPLTPGGGNWSLWLDNNGFLRLTNASGGGAITPAGLVQAGAWQQLAVVVQGTRVWFYVNGVLKNAQGWSGNSGGGAMPFSVGAGLRATLVPEGFFNGDIDEVKVLSTALDAAGVAADYEASRRGRFAVQYSTTAGQLWNVVSATYPGAGMAWASLSGPDGSNAAETLTVRDLSLAQSTTTATGALGSDLLQFLVPDRRGNYTLAGPFTVLVDTVAAAAVSTPTYPSPGVFASTTPVFSWGGPSTATAAGMGAAARFLLEVSQTPDFAAPVVSVTTPVVVTASGAAFTQGVTLPPAALADQTTYYWRVRAQDYLGVLSAPLTVTSFVTAYSTPVTSAFASLNSTGGLVAEAIGLPLASGVTAQVTVQQAGVDGLELAPQDGVTSYGAMYTAQGTAALPTWVDGSTATALSDAAQTAVTAMARHAGKLWAATAGGHVWSYDGSAWGLSASLGSQVDALESFNGTLYAGLAGAGQVWRYDGVSWSLAATLAAGGSVQALKAYAGRLYAGDSAGRVWGYEPATNQWFSAFAPGAAVQSLGVYDGRLFVGANPSVYSYDGTAWDVSTTISASINSFAAYDNKLYATTNNLGKVYQFDGTSWTVSFTPAESQTYALANHAGRLYATTKAASNGRVYVFDTKSWVLTQTFATPNDQALSMKAYGGDLYIGMQTAAGSAQVLVSTPLVTSLTGVEGTQSPQTLSVYGLNLAPSAGGSVCNGSAGCSATDMVRFSALGRSGRVGQAGPFAILVDTLLSKPTTYYPASGGPIHENQPDFTWVETSTMPNHVVQVSTVADFSALQVNQTVTGGAYFLASPITLANATTYYWRVQAQDVLGVPSAFSDPASFFIDVNPPSTSTYLHFNSTGGALAEGQITNLATGATFTLSVQDPLSGLAPSPLGSLPRVAVYAFEETGALAFDLSGANRHAALSSGGIRSASGRRGAGLFFNGAGGGVFAPAAGIASWPGLTAAAWVRPTAATAPGQTILAGGQFRLQANNAQGRAQYQALTTGAGGCSPQTAQTFPVDAWQHVAFEMDPPNNKNEIYVNGQLAGSCTGAGAAADQPFDVGIDTVSGIAGASGFAGYIDEVRLYYAAVPAAVLQAEMNAAPFGLLFSTNAGGAWSAVASTGPFGPRLSFTGAPGATTPQSVSAVDLPLVQSTNTSVCGQAVPCAATDQLVWYVPDLAGSVRTAGPFAVIVDTAVPRPAMTELFPTSTDQLYAIVASSPDLAGARDFLFEASTAPDFSVIASSSGFVPQSTWTYTGLTDATTYYARAWARDMVLNVSTPSVALATSTFGSVFFATASAVPAGAPQGTLVPMLTLFVNTRAGASSQLLSLSVRRTGSALDSDVDQVLLYNDTGSGVFSSTTDSQLAAGTLANGQATLSFSGSGAPLSVQVSTFHVVFQMDPGAFTTRSVGVEVSSAASVDLAVPGHAFGPFPMEGGPIPVADGPNQMFVTATNLAPAAVQPGTNDVPILQLRTVTDTGTSTISSVTVTLSGTLPPNTVRSVNLWRDVTPPLGFFNPNVDIRLTSDTDAFGSTNTATMRFGGFDVSSRTVTNNAINYWVTLSMAANAPQGSAFQVGLASTRAFTLQDVLDNVAFNFPPIVTSTVTVILNNTLTVAAADQAPAAFTQGNRFSLLRATMTVDKGSAEVNAFTARLTGTGQPADVSAVEVWSQTSVNGANLNPILDTMIGSAPFSGSGIADVAVATQTLLSGTTSVFFLSYLASPSATPGVTLGVKLSTGDVAVGNAGTTVSGAFPFASSTAPVQATVNHLLVANGVHDISPGSIQQGQRNVPMLRLDALSDNNNILWLGLTVQKQGTAADGAVSSVDVWQDYNGDGVFEADIDSRITSGANVFASSAAALSFTPTPAVTASTRTYFVTLNVAPTAVPGTTLGVTVLSTAAFALLAPNAASTSTVFPLASSLVPINQFQNTVSVSTASIVPALGASPGANDVGLMMLTLKTNVSNTVWQSLRVDQAGTASDPDVKQVKLYFDTNGSGVFDTSNLNNYALVTATGQAFGSNGPGSVVLNISTPQVLGPLPKNYFLAVDLSTSATPGRAVVVRASTGAFFSVNAPNVVDPNASFASPPLAINAPPATVYVVGADSAPATVTQGTPNVPMLTLKVFSNSFPVPWTQLRVTRTGSGQDSDVPSVKLYYDSAGSGVLDVSADQRLSTAAFSGGAAFLTFATQTVTASTRTYFLTYDVQTTAPAGDTLGAEIAAAGDVHVQTPNTVATGGFPILSSTPTVAATQTGLFVTGTNLSPGVLRQAATAQVLLTLSLQTTQYALTWSALTLQSTGTAVDSDIKAVSVWLDNDNNGVVDVGTDALITSGLNAFLGGTAVVSLSQPQSIGTQPKQYLVAVDVAPFARPGHTFAVVLPSTAAFGVSAPNFTVAQNFPVQSDVNATVAKLPESLVVTPTDLVGSGVDQGANQALARLDARASRNQVGWTGLTVQQNGNLGATQIDSVGVWRDADGNGVLDAGDLLVGSAAFSGSQAFITFSTAQTVGVATQTYFVTAQPDISATVGATVRLSLQQPGFIIASPDAAGSAGLPFTTSPDVVLDAKTPTQPAVGDDGAYSSDFEGLDFTWASTVASGSLAGAFYEVGTTPGGGDVRAWTAIPAALTSVRATGFPLLQGSTYYVSVKTQSSFGFNSPVGTAPGILMDFSVPPTPAPGVTAGQSSLLITWATAPGGPSGIVGYLVEYRTGASPVWFNAVTGQQTGVSAAGLPRAAAFTAKGAAPGALRLMSVSTSSLVTGGSFQATGLPSGTLFVRVRSVSGSGVVSPAGDPVKVQLGPLPAGGISDASVYPNPFDSRKTSGNVTYVLSQAADMSIKVYSVFGRLLRQVSYPAGGNGGLAGANTVAWDGSDDSGRKVAKGLYLMVLQSGGAKTIIKVGVIH